MPRAPRPWFRFYVETFPDRKVRRLQPAERWVWAAVLGAARESPEPGRLMIADGLPMTMAELADYADVPLRLAAKALDAMVRMGMVVMDGEVITAPKFTSRQYESDDVTARTRKHRERSNDVPTEDVGTFQRGSGERSPDGGRNAPETDTKKEQTLSSAPPPSEPISLQRPKGILPASLNPVFAEFWAAYPKRVGRADAERKFVIAVRAVEPAVLITGARSYAAACVANQTEARFVAHPATWLHQGRWADEAGPASREDDPMGWAR